MRPFKKEFSSISLPDPVGILGPDHVTGVECHLQRLGEFDTSGRRRPVPIEETEFEGAEFVLDADIFIPAIGQASDLECFDGKKRSAPTGVTDHRQCQPCDHARRCFCRG